MPIIRPLLSALVLLTVPAALAFPAGAGTPRPSPPDVVALLEPLPAPVITSRGASPAAAKPPSSRAFRVVCSAVDANGHELPVTARLLLGHHEMDLGGSVQVDVRPIDVMSGDIVEISLLPPRLIGRVSSNRYASARIDETGNLAVETEFVALDVQTTDASGAWASATYDPTQEPSPLCETIRPDGRCAPSLSAGLPTLSDCLADGEDANIRFGCPIDFDHFVYTDDETSHVFVQARNSPCVWFSSTVNSLHLTSVPIGQSDVHVTYSDGKHCGTVFHGDQCSSAPDSTCSPSQKEESIRVCEAFALACSGH